MDMPAHHQPDTGARSVGPEAGPVVANQGDLLRATGISKHYDGVIALADAELTIRAGEVHALVGQNGAGKSTLLRCLAGVERPDSGSISLNGEPVHFASPQEGLDAGIAVVHQELMLFPSLTVAENLTGSWRGQSSLIRWRKAYAAAQQVLDDLKLNLDPKARVEQLHVGLQQMVEIVRALHSGARLIFLDEPTSALSSAEIDMLFEFVRRLTDQGVAFVLVTHFVDDVFAHADRVTVLRDGRVISTSEVASLSRSSLVEAIVGRGHDSLQRTIEGGSVRLPAAATSPIVLRSNELSMAPTVHEVSIEVHTGEIVAVFGDLASGHLDLARILFGLAKQSSGSIEIDGVMFNALTPTQARDAGMGYIPADRRQGLALEQAISRNMTLANLHQVQGRFLRVEREQELSEGIIGRLGIAGGEARRHVAALSGGNQQKVLFGRWLVGSPPKVLVLVEPTRGMDVGAKDDVFEIIANLATDGTGVLIITSEPETAIGIAQRIVVMHRGRIVREFADQELSQKQLLEASL
jgi:ribose transport system ATP-binding protein